MDRISKALFSLKEARYKLPTRFHVCAVIDITRYSGRVHVSVGSDHGVGEGN